MAPTPTLEEWLEDPDALWGPAVKAPAAAARPAAMIEPDEVEPGPHHPWRAAYAALHPRARKLLRRFRRETGTRGLFAVHVVAFANWTLGLRVDSVGASWRHYLRWSRAAIEALPATAQDRQRAMAILREEPGAATGQEVADRLAHASDRAGVTRLRRASRCRENARRARRAAARARGNDADQVR